MSVKDRNKRRIARMSTWISHAEAEAISGEEEAHIRFLFYWIAYEAAYHMNETGESKGGHEKERREFHLRLASHDRGKVQNILRAQKDDVVGILELRQAHPSFWKVRKVRKGSKDRVAETAEAWERDFGKWVRSARKRLNEAAAERTGRDEPHDAVWYQRKIAGTLNHLFENLSVVRHQIVHGGSAGPDSRGRTQVIRGAKLLNAFVPCFHKVIKANPNEDWGEPPFPRVGSGPDDKCPPPWLS